MGAVIEPDAIAAPYVDYEHLCRYDQSDQDHKHHLGVQAGFGVFIDWTHPCIPPGMVGQVGHLCVHNDESGETAQVLWRFVDKDTLKPVPAAP